MWSAAALILLLVTAHEVTGSWNHPAVNTNWVDDSGCETVTDVIQRVYFRHHDGKAAKTDPLRWDQVEIYAMPERVLIPHGMTGTVDVGDTACTTPDSRQWIYGPTGGSLWSYCKTYEWTDCPGSAP